MRLAQESCVAGSKQIPKITDLKANLSWPQAEDWFYRHFICASRKPLCSWLLTIIPALFCHCQYFACKKCPRAKRRRSNALGLPQKREQPKSHFHQKIEKSNKIQTNGVWSVTQQDRMCLLFACCWPIPWHNSHDKVVQRQKSCVPQVGSKDERCGSYPVDKPFVER